MEPETAWIPADSRQEAMDWGLVLASQGIEAAILGPEGEQAWRLEVAAGDRARALRAIKQYRLESRGWPWQGAVLRQGYPFDWASLVWVLLLLLFFWREGRSGLAAAGMMVSARVAQGQWWRLFTAVWLHADVGHLATNATLGFVLMGLVMGRYGPGVGLLAAYLAGAAGNLCAWLLAPPSHRSLGASGMVLGCLGLLAAQAFSFSRRNAPPPRLLASGILAGVMLFVLLGLGPGTDVVAHLGGFLAGLLLGALLASLPGLAHRPAANLLGALLFATLLILPWSLARGD
jgi:membrane associated rhomboid family serine protease